VPIASSPRILAFAGSSRRDSFNKRLVQVASIGAAEAGGQCTFIDLRDYPLPIYDGDLEAEQGLPENAERLRTLFSNHDGILLSSPEYNGSIPALLKNTIDWITRSPEHFPDLAPVSGKIVGLMAASPGPLGGMRVLRHLRTVLGDLGCIILPGPLALRKAHEAFADSGDLQNDQQREAAKALGREVVRWVEKLS
jgi:chromate reductase